MDAKWSDEKLLEQFKESGDQKAFHELYRRYKDHAFRFLKRTLPADADVDNVFHEVWLSLVAGDLERVVSFKALFYTVARRRRADFYEVASRNPLDLRVVTSGGSAEDDSPDELDGITSPDATPEQVMAWKELSQRYEKALSQLPLLHRDAYLLYQDGLTVTEIAEVMGVGPATALSYKRNAIERLKKLLADVLERNARSSPQDVDNADRKNPDQRDAS
jgi:RNA polymerase sigma-70 factor (ECF subfamily)